jgi:hypothetical protein
MILYLEYVIWFPPELRLRSKCIFLATGSSLGCDGSLHCCSIHPELLLSSLGKVENTKTGKGHATQISFSDFTLENQRVLLGLQICSHGSKECLFEQGE